MSGNSSSGSRGVTLSTVLVVVFFVLKVTGNIDWSWWWVFSPWLITFAVGLAIGVLVLLAGKDV